MPTVPTIAHAETLAQALPLSVAYEVSPLKFGVNVDVYRDDNKIFCDVDIEAQEFITKIFANKITIASQALYTRNARIIPLEYRYTADRHPDDENHYQFHWKQGYIQALHDQKRFKMALQKGVLDQNSLYLQLIQDVASAGERFGRSYRVARRDKIKELRFFFAGKETLQTPIGTFATLKILRKKRDTVDQALWLSPQHAYLPLKFATMRDDKEQYTALITRVSLGYKER